MSSWSSPLSIKSSAVSNKAPAPFGHLLRPGQSRHASSIVNTCTVTIKATTPGHPYNFHTGPGAAEPTLPPMLYTITYSPTDSARLVFVATPINPLEQVCATNTASHTSASPIIITTTFGTSVSRVPKAPAAKPHNSTNRCPNLSMYRPAIGVTTALVR